VLLNWRLYIKELLEKYKAAIKQITSLTSQLQVANARIAELELELESTEEVEDWNLRTTTK